jgi:TonB family protein
MMKLTRGFVLSLLIHGLLFFGGAGYLAWKTAQAGASMEIDLAHSSLLLRPRRVAGPARVVPPEPWYLTTGKKAQATAPLVKAPPAPEPPEEQTAGPVGEPADVFLPAAAASRIPEWVDGLITEDDYPPAARKQGKEGKVVATVAIDAAGQVKDVQITEGSYPEFNALVLDRLRHARFRPARDQNDNPIAVRMSLPIVFELH